MISRSSKECRRWVMILFGVLGTFQGGGPLFAATVQSSDVIVNHRERLTNSRTIEIDATRISYPQVWVSLGDPRMINPEVLRNAGSPVTYTLPERNRTYWIHIGFADGSGVLQPGVITATVELDTIPPVVEIVSPKNNSVTGQGFVHLQANVFDPSPDRGDGFTGRRVGVWINGERFWNRKGDRVDIPRFEVVDGTNTLSIVVEDEASNRTAAVVQWFVDLNLDTTPPKLSQINLHPDKTGKVQFPDEPKIIIQGILDDSNAVVTVTVNRDPPKRMNVRGNVFVSQVALYEGDNTVVLSAIDGAGNQTDYRYTLVRSNRYRARITSLDAGGFTLRNDRDDGGPNLSTTAPDTNQLSQASIERAAWADIMSGHTPAIVSGYVSALRDEGETNEARLVSVNVNGVPTVLGSVDQNGNIPFKTLQPVPLPSREGAAIYDVKIRWSDGQVYE